METLRNRWLSISSLLLFLTFMAAPMGSQADSVDLEAAKKEGTVVVYATVPSKAMAAINKAFEKKYGIKVQYWRGSSSKVLDRALTEWRVGRPGFDIVESSRGAQLIMRKEGFYVKYDPLQRASSLHNSSRKMDN